MTDWLNRNQVAELLGVVPGTVTHYAYLTAAIPEGDRQPWDFPLPTGWVPRPVGVPGPKRERAWPREAVLAWRAAQESKPLPAKARDETGRFARKAGV